MENTVYDDYGENDSTPSMPKVTLSKSSIHSILHSRKRHMLTFIVSVAALCSLLISLVTLLINQIAFMPIYVLLILIMVYMIAMVISSSIKLYKINKLNQELINKYLPKDDVV